jgi:hypothetical protein
MVWRSAGAAARDWANLLLTIAINLPAALYVYGILFFSVGFIFYGSLMAGIGAMAPNLREGSQSTFFVALPLILTLVAVNSLIQMPHGGLATVLSLLPPTAPVAMMTRLTIGDVPAGKSRWLSGCWRSPMCSLSKVCPPVPLAKTADRQQILLQAFPGNWSHAKECQNPPYRTGFCVGSAWRR